MNIPTCAAQEETITTYLYDNDGTLLATFNQDDNVIDMFINGPDGIVASFYQNSDTKLHHYFKDHLGSTRLTMTGPPLGGDAEVTAWYNYHPFGSLKETYESYSTPFRFTSKELDDETTFGLYYFGARYYDGGLARFATPDKAGQFASGYVYGINNPISIYDPDGNFAWFAFSLGFLFGANQGLSIARADNTGFLESLGYSLAGGLIGGFSSVGGANIAASKSAILGSATGSFTNSVGFGALSGGRSNVAVNFGFGSYNLSTGNFSPINFKGNVLDVAGDVMGALTVLEDLNKIWPDALRKGTKDIEGNPEALGVDIDKAEEVLRRETHEPFTHANRDYEITEPLPHAGSSELFKGKSHRLWSRPGKGPQGIQVDIYSNSKLGIQLDYDAFAGGFENPGTAIQHIIFDAGPHVLRQGLPPVLNQIGYNTLNFSFGFYRSCYIYNQFIQRKY